MRESSLFGCLASLWFVLFSPAALPGAELLTVNSRGYVYGTLLDRNGTVLEPDGFAVANDSIPEMFAHVAANGGEFVIGGSVFRQEPGYVAYRIALSGPLRSVGVADPPANAGRLMLTLSPNPLVGQATILLRAVSGERASVMVYDVAGRAVRRLLEGPAASETVRLEWDLRDQSGQVVGPGVYFVTARTPDGASAVRVAVSR